MKETCRDPFENIIILIVSDTFVCTCIKKTLESMLNLFNGFI